ncbi:endospore germination permease [Alicyclobacillus curvatus]|nr:endospore germination permease [Alicyclobacillus curvatus]
MPNKLTRIETLLLMFWTIMGTGILAIPFAIGHFTTRDGWLSPLFLPLPGLTMVIVAVVYARFNQGNLIQSLRQSFGLFIGGGIGVWYTLCLFIITATVWRELTEFMGTTVYPDTPVPLVSSMLVFPISYGVHKGIKSIGSFGEFLAPLALIVTTAVVLFSIMDMHLDSLFPTLADGWRPILRGSVVPSITYALEPLVIVQIVQDLNSRKTLGRDLIITLFFVVIALVLIEVVVIAVLGSSVGELTYPILEVIRSISVGEFIERLDTFYVMGVLSTIYIKLAVFHYAFCKALEELFHLSSYRVIVWTGALAAWAASMFLFPDTNAVAEFITFATPAYFIVTLLCIPVLLTIRQSFSKNPRSQSTG